MRNPYETQDVAAEADWRSRAACVNQDPELFFPATGSAKSIVGLGRAQLVCAACPVREACLRWAIRTESDYGVWGGVGESERRRLDGRIPRRGRPPRD